MPDSCQAWPEIQRRLWEKMAHRPFQCSPSPSQEKKLAGSFATPKKSVAGFESFFVTDLGQLHQVVRGSEFKKLELLHG
jgi:hypothetical protein